MGSRVVSLGFVAILALVFLPAAADGGQVLIPGSSVAPPILSRVDLDPGVTTIAISPRGDRAAIARLSTETKTPTTTLSIFSMADDAPVEMTIPGAIRDLIYLQPDDALVGIQHRARKKREGETYLVRFEPGESRLRRLLRLPISANDLELWPARQSLIVASRNELRTFRLPDFRSAPLYRLTGNNLAVSVLAGTDFVIIGRASDIALVNLSDPPGRPDMPVRERLAISAPVSSIASSPDGRSALARLFDGRVLSVGFNPLRGEVTGTAVAVTSLFKETGRPAIPPSADLEEEPEPKIEIDVAPPVVEEVLVEELSAESETAEALVQEEKTPAVVAPVTSAETPPTPKPEPEEAVPQEPTTTSQLSGTLVGPARAEVKSVVLYGPNNILREARRITPDGDGRWAADGLTPGRYRLQLDGGGQRVLVSDPASVFLEIEESGRLQTPEIRVLRSF